VDCNRIIWNVYKNRDLWWSPRIPGYNNVYTHNVYPNRSGYKMSSSSQREKTRSRMPSDNGVISSWSIFSSCILIARENNNTYIYILIMSPRNPHTICLLYLLASRPLLYRYPVHHYAFNTISIEDGFYASSVTSSPEWDVRQDEMRVRIQK